MPLAQPPSTLNPPGPGSGTTLPVPYFPQVVNSWCWAACASMVLGYYKQNVNQCSVAEFLLKVSCCPDPDLCDAPCAPSDVLRIYQHYNLNAKAVQGSVSAMDLQNELAARRPIELGLGSSASGHLVIVFGFTTAGANTSFQVHDPIALGTGPVSYDELLNGMGRGSWLETWKNIC